MKNFLENSEREWIQRAVKALERLATATEGDYMIKNEVFTSTGVSGESFALSETPSADDASNFDVSVAGSIQEPGVNFTYSKSTGMISAVGTWPADQPVRILYIYK